MGINIDEYKCQLKEMSDFYINLSDNVDLESDIHSIQIAKKNALTILTVINKKELNKKNIQTLESCIMSLIKGVGQFDDIDIQRKHQKYGELRYKFLEHIDLFL